MSRALLLIMLFVPVVGAAPLGVEVETSPIKVSSDPASVETDPVSIQAAGTCLAGCPPTQVTEPVTEPEVEPAPAPSSAKAAPTPEEVVKAASSHLWETLAGLAVVAALAVWSKTYGFGRTIGWIVKGTGVIGALLFSRIHRDRLADHPLRARILDAVGERPGVNLQQLKDSLGVAWGTVVHHVNRLERERLIHSQKVRGERMFFMPGAGQEMRVGLGLVKTGTGRRIARVVLDSPGLDQSSLCARLSIANPTASKHLKRLENGGLVQSTRVDRRRFYRPTDRLATVLGTA